MTDFLVIGGGIAGVSAGARLSEFGKVTVLEAESALGYHASGRSAALFEESYGAGTVLTLNQASRPFLEAGGYLSPRGVMLVGTATTEDKLAAQLAPGLFQPISVAEMIEKVPILNPATVTRGGYDPRATDIDTDRLLQDFARTIRQAGGDVLTGRRVSAIRREGGRWIAEAAGETFEAPVLLDAAGAWADQIAQMAGLAPMGLQPLRRSIARTPAPGGRDVSGWPMMFGAGEGWYAKPDAGAWLISPAEEDRQEPHDAWADDMVLAEGIARYEECVTEPVTRLITSWAGLRTFAPDRQSILGPDPLEPAFVWVAGQGGYGFQTCAAASRLVADLVTGRASELDEATVATLRPERFRR